MLVNQPAYCHTTTSLTGSRSQIRRDQSHNNKRYIAGLFQFVTASELAAHNQREHATYLAGIVAAIEDTLEYLTPADRAAVLHTVTNQAD